MLSQLLKQAAEELNRRESARDQVLTRARRARLLSKQSILYTHNDEYHKAQENLAEARRLILEMTPSILEFPELDHYDETEAAYEEYSEASILYALETTRDYPTPNEIGVGTLRYILGLADVPGELRREALDELRHDNSKKAEAYLTRMEEIYTQLVTMEDASLLLKGLRRKLDIARGVTEATRAELTAEAGRRRLADTVQKLTDRLKD